LLLVKPLLFIQGKIGKTEKKTEKKENNMKIKSWFEKLFLSL